MADNPFAAAIASIESGGERDPYAALGPATRSGDQAHGKYQIMGANIGPWSKEILGTELTPQQFLADPQAQDAIFNGKFQQYVDKFGPEGAARAWIGGPGAVNKPDRADNLGTTVNAYGQKFIKALGLQGAASQTPPRPSQPVGAPGPPLSILPQDVNRMPAYGWSPAGQQAAQQPGAMQAMAQQQAPPQMQLTSAQRPPPRFAPLTYPAQSPATAPGFRFYKR